MAATSWLITETQFDPAKLHAQEAIFTIGNGYLCSRGSFEEGYPNAWPSTLIHGVFDDVPLFHSELANAPNWLSLNIMLNEEWFTLAEGTILAYRRQLDLRNGILSRTVCWRSPQGYTLEMAFERFVSLVDSHVLALRCWVSSVDFTGRLTLQSDLHGYQDNWGVLHWDIVEQGASEQQLWLHTRTRHSKIEVGMAAQLTVSQGHKITTAALPARGVPTISETYQIEAGQTLTATKLVTIFTSRDIKTPLQAAKIKLQKLSPYEGLRNSQHAAWDRLWKTNDVIIEGDEQAQQAVRFNLFQLLIATPWHHDDRVNIGAKLLSGFGYRGHAFWDTEIFMLPMFTLLWPDIARNLLRYRHRTLPEARKKAQAHGFAGAMFAWESGTTGKELTPTHILDPETQKLIRIWCRDIELHINADIAYATWHYWQITADDEFMRRYGAELILETAIFWGSRVQSEGKQYHIKDVIGPDEYHEHVDDNFFTNEMVRWHLRCALQILDWLRANHPQKATLLEESLDLSPKQTAHWERIIERLVGPSQEGLIEQFTGYFSLEDERPEALNLPTEQRAVSFGLRQAQGTQIIKQPDVLMLLYLLGDNFSEETLRQNWDYYVPRTNHAFGSSLGPAIHAILACRLDKVKEAYQFFLQAALVDLHNTQGNTAMGIHAASTGAIWQAVVFGFGGLKFTAEGPHVTAKLPLNWTRLKFKVQWRGQWYNFDLKPRPEIRAVIFDLDGVLTETAEFHYQAWNKLAQEEGWPFNRAKNDGMRGLSRRDSLLYLLDNQPLEEMKLQELMTRKNNYYQDHIANMGANDLLPGVADLLAELRSAGLKLAVGSASKNAKPVLKKLGIAQQFDIIADGYSVQKSKPAPDLFLLVAHKLGVAPRNCLVIEDAAAGIAAACTAGMRVVGLGPPERVGQAHLILSNLKGITWKQLRSRLQLR